MRFERGADSRLLNGRRAGWPSRPEGRLDRDATRSITIRKHFSGERPNNDASCERKVFEAIDTAWRGFLSLRDPTATNLSVSARARGRATLRFSVPH
jgi:hypothetical protein